MLANDNFSSRSLFWVLFVHLILTQRDSTDFGTRALARVLESRKMKTRIDHFVLSLVICSSLQVINFPILHLEERFRSNLLSRPSFELRTKTPAEENDKDQFNYQF